MVCPSPNGCLPTRARFARGSPSGRDFSHRAPPARRSVGAVSIKSRGWNSCSRASNRFPDSSPRSIRCGRSRPPATMKPRGLSSPRYSTFYGTPWPGCNSYSRRENAIDYPESTLIALRALSSEEQPSELLLALDMQIEHLLLDEFQDTSLAQHQLVEHLTGRSGRPAMGALSLSSAIRCNRFTDSAKLTSACFSPRRGPPHRRCRARAVDVDAKLSLAARPGRLGERYVFQRVFIVRRCRARIGRVQTVSGDPPTACRWRGDRRSLHRCHAGGCGRRIRIRGALASTAESIAVLVRKRSDLAEILPALRAGDIAFSAVELDYLSRAADRARPVLPDARTEFNPTTTWRGSQPCARRGAD